MKASELLASRAPVRVVVLPSTSWTSEQGAPVGELAVGIRCLSHAEVITARAEASKEGAEASTARGLSAEDRAHRFGAALMAWTVGFSACDPNDARQPFFKCGDEDARRLLTPEALRRLWDETEMAHLESSPLRAEASDEDLAELALTIVDPDAWREIPRGDAARLRRFLRFALDALTLEK